jgi:hypothetical protein
VHGVCQLLLAYPRLDVAHLYEGAVTTILVGTVMLERTVMAFRRATAQGRLRWLPVAITTATLMVCGVKLAPRLHDQLTWRDGLRVRYRTELSGPRGGLYSTRVEDRRWFASLNQIEAFVRTHAPAGSPIFTYPALSGIYFLTGRDNPTAMDYFYHGFGEGIDEIDVVSALERTQTPMVVLMDDYSFDPTHLGHFPLLKDYVRRHFVQTAYIEPFRVLERVQP